MTKLLTLDILFSTAFRTVLLAKLVILGISPLMSFILALRVVLVAKLVISGILSSIFFYLSIIYIFFNDIIFITSLSLLKSTGTGNNLSTSNLSILLFKYLKVVETFNLSILDFELAKSTFLAKDDV